MIGAVSGPGSYAGVQWSSYVAPARNSTSTAAENPSVTAVPKSSGLETPVQPVDAATPVTSKVSGNLNIALSVQNSVDITEMAVRRRISPAESDESAQSIPLPGTQETTAQGSVAEDNAQAQEIGTLGGRVEDPLATSEDVQDKLETEEAERQERLEEQAQLEQEAEAEREAYLESLAEAEQARDQRVEALREALSEDSGTGEKENAVSPVGEENEETLQAGSLKLDYTAALLQNYQMSNLLQAQITARMNGEDTTNYNAALDSIRQSGQNRVRFVSDSEEDHNSAARYAYQQRMNELPFGIVA